MNTALLKLGLFPTSGDGACWKLNFQKDPIESPTLSYEEANRHSLRNLLFFSVLYSSGRWTKCRIPGISSVTYYCHRHLAFVITAYHVYTFSQYHIKYTELLIMHVSAKLGQEDIVFRKLCFGTCLKELRKSKQVLGVSQGLTFRRISRLRQFAMKHEARFGVPDADLRHAL